MNISVGVLGHVDSGKTSLCKSLSSIPSTAAFDSNPQSIERGITLDLGFSSFNIGEKWTFTLVDCPGHSSLIRTVIGGSQIMDIMLLIVDINKGMQPQTAECLILAQITSSHLIVLLNKVDLVPLDQRPQKVAKVLKLMRGALEKTKFGDAPILPFSSLDPSIGTENFKEALVRKVETMNIVRDKSSPFLMAIDHCFSKKGQGTVLTGTILQGRLKLNDPIEIPRIGETRKVKSIQSFRRSLQEAGAGDRVGISVAGLDPSLLERTIISAPGAMQTLLRVAVISLTRINFFKQPIRSKRRYHISIGYETITAKLTLFMPRTEGVRNSEVPFEPSNEHVLLEEVPESGAGTDWCFAVAEFDSPAMALPQGLLIGSDLQSDLQCRLAFTGRLLSWSEDKNYAVTFLPSIRILRWKEKIGGVDRVQGPTTLIVSGFCKRESAVEHLLNLTVTLHLDLGEAGTRSIFGRIESRFGQTNKLRVQLQNPLSPEETSAIKTSSSTPVILRYSTNHFKRVGGDKRIQQ